MNNSRVCRLEKDTGEGISKADSPKMFNAIAGRYDLLNYVLSFGMDAAWRRRLARSLSPRKGLKVLDLATGTGDVAIALARFWDPSINVIGVDLAEDMLALGRDKIKRRGLTDKIKMQNADAQALPFPESSFDAVTVAFGLRNMPDLTRAMAEAARVLKPGGQFIILEFSYPNSFLIKPFHSLYLHYIVPVIGMLLTGNFQAYQYLSQTIRRFPYGERFQRIIRQVGLENVSAQELAFGAATIYVAQKKI